VIGRWVFKLIGLAVMGALALVLGSEFLVSVTWTVTQVHLGNFLPFISIIGITILLMLWSGHTREGKSLGPLLDILGYASTAFLVVVVFTLMIPMGLFSSLLSAMGTVLICSLVRDPSDITGYLDRIGLAPISLLERYRCRDIHWTTYEYRNVAYLIDNRDASAIIEVIRQNPDIPLSLTRYIDCYGLIAPEENRGLTLSVMRLREIAPLARDSRALRSMTVGLPLILLEEGYDLSEYAATRLPVAVEYLLKEWPQGATLFNDGAHLRMLLLRGQGEGLDLAALPKGRERMIVVDREYSLLME
jgi:hypothetical protein